MRLMKAAVVHRFGEPLQIEDVPVPEVTPGQNLVKVVASGVCHTDLHAAEGDWPVKPALPFIPGHEGVGFAAAIGAGVKGVKEGDRVGVPWLHTACGCLRRRRQGAHGLHRGSARQRQCHPRANEAWRHRGTDGDAHRRRRLASSRHAPAPTDADDRRDPSENEMTRLLLAILLLGLLLAGMPRAEDAPFYVPAHRTTDGSYVPPNVPPNSAAAKPASGPAESHQELVQEHRRLRRGTPEFVPPMFVDAPPFRR